MKHLFILLTFVCLLASCKTSEANYRAAYDKAVAAREADDTEDTIYGGASRRLDQKFMISGNDTIPINVKMVTLVSEKDAPTPVLNKFMVVAGQFKQKFNAMSLCKRLIDAGYDGAAVVQTSEPYYYVVASSYDKVSDADLAMNELKKKAPVAMKDPVPFILRDPRK